MKLERRLNTLVSLAMEVPALSSDQEGLLKGGFCSIATEDGIGLLSKNTDCKYNNCVSGCKKACNVGCKIECNEGCPTDTTDPSDPDGEETSKAANPGAALMGFSLVF